MTVDPDSAAYFLNGAISEIRYDTMELDHSAWAEPIYVVRNRRAGLTATLETMAEVTFQYVPMVVRRAGAQDDLDHVMEFQLGDLGTIVPDLIDLIRAAAAFDEHPVVRFRSFRSSDLSAPLEGPVTLQAGNLRREKGGVAFDARAPRLNLNRTGVRFTIERFAMMKALI